jgi:dienelactone hydrolase
MTPGPLASYSSEQQSHGGKSRTIYRRGTGPAVIVLAEIPGITPNVVRFADRVVEAGFTAVLPHLFGDDGAEPTSKQIQSVGRRVCISREFTVFATGKSSPIVGWLKLLASAEHQRCGGPGVGVVGMCMTGGFALGMLVESAVVAPVLSQPSIPIALGPFKRSRAGRIDVSDADMATIKHRLADEQDLCVLGFRFSLDPLVPEDRFRYLEQELGNRFIGRSFPSTSPRDHSVLTESLQDEALHDVLRFFDNRLKPDAGSPVGD